MSTADRIVFVDVESTGLDFVTHEVWEVALIERRPLEDGTYADHETHLYVKPKRLDLADPNALIMNRFYERTHGFNGSPGDKPGPSGWMGTATAAARIARVTAGAVLVGSNPAFDATMLTKLLRGHGCAPAWYYRPVCVATMAYAFELGATAEHNHRAVENSQETVEPDAAAASIRFKSRDLSELLGVKPPQGDDQHTAMADARWARDMYDAMLAGGA